MLRLDNQGALYSQLYRALRGQILDGTMRPGTRVPSTRTMARELLLSRNVVMIAYEQLLAEGYLVARAGAGTFVAPELPQLFTLAGASAGKVEAVDDYLGDQAEVSGVDAGLHILLWLRKVPQGLVEALRKSAEKAGVGVYSVAPYYSTPPPQAGLLLGYGTLSEKEITEGVRRLASVLRTQ